MSWITAGNPTIVLNDKDQFYWYFEGAGSASIDEVGEQSDGSFFTQYSYLSGNEKRTGKNVFYPTKTKNKYKGTWVTHGNTGNKYEGELELIFEENGTAMGYWTWKGADGKWKIELRKKSK